MTDYGLAGLYANVTTKLGTVRLGYDTIRITSSCLLHDKKSIRIGIYLPAYRAHLKIVLYHVWIASVSHFNITFNLYMTSWLRSNVSEK